MAALPSFFPPKFWDGAEVAAGYKLWAFVGGTDTPKTVYKDQEGAEAHENPITLNQSGEVDDGLFLGDGFYTFRLNRPAELGGGIVRTWDGVSDGSNGADAQIPEEVILAQGQQAVTFASLTYTVGNGSLVLELNGLILNVGDDYTETSEVSVFLTQSAKAGDQLTARVGSIVNPASAIGTVSSAALAAADGAELVGFKYTATGSGLGEVWDWLNRSSVHLHAFDPAASTVAQQTTRLANAISQALSVGRPLKLEPGQVHRINASSVSVGTNQQLFIWGENSVLVFDGLASSTDTGLNVLLNAGTSTFVCKGITFKTSGTAGRGVRVEYTPVTYDFRSRRRVHMEDVFFEGENYETKGWNTQLELVDIHNGKIVRLTGTGRSSGTDDDTEASNTVSPVCVKITSSTDGASAGLRGGDIVFDDPVFYSFADAMDAGGKMEGITVNNPTALNCGGLIKWQPESGEAGRPGLWVTDGHCSTYSYVVKVVDGVSQGTVKGLLAYHNQGAASNWKGLQLDNAQGWTITGNTFARYCSGAQTSTAMEFTGSQASDIVVDDNIIGERTQLDTGISMSGIPSGAVLIGTKNRWSSAGFRVTDVAYPGNLQILGEREFLGKLSADTGVGSATLTTINWDTLVYDSSTLGYSAGTFTVPSGKHIRRLLITATVTWQANATGDRSIFLYVGAGQVVPISVRATSAGTTGVSLSHILVVAPGDTFSIRTSQSSGGALNMLAQLCHVSIRVLT